MAHELFGERFYSHRVPAWHRLGLVLDEPLTATEAFDRVGAYDVWKEAVFTASGINTGQHAIVRGETKDDPTKRVFGIVSEDYTLVTPKDIVSIWDRNVGATVETLGSLSNGDTIFMSTKLPTYDIAGDEVENYLLVTSPMNGRGALEMRVTPIRVVCRNTLIASASVATDNYVIHHDKTALVRTAEWLHDMYAQAMSKLNTLESLFNRMAETKATEAPVDNVLEFAYKMPALPKRNCPEGVYAERMHNHEVRSEQVAKRREGARELFYGKGVGMDTQAAAGTVWGVYNAVAEMEAFSTGTNERQKAESFLYGERGQRTARAFDAAVVEIGRK